MTWFGVVVVCIYVVSTCANFYAAGNGGTHTTAGACLFSGFLGIAMLLGVIFIGTGLGI